MNLTLDDAKAAARALRRSLAATDITISHSHHGDGTPGTVVWVPIGNADAFHADIWERPHPRLRPGINREAPGGPTVEVTDPSGNVLRFCEATDRSVAEGRSGQVRAGVELRDHRPQAH